MPDPAGAPCRERKRVERIEIVLVRFGQRTVGSHGIWCLWLHRPKEPLYCPQAVLPKGFRFLSNDLDRFRRCHRTDVEYRHSDLHARVLLVVGLKCRTILAAMAAEGSRQTFRGNMIE